MALSKKQLLAAAKLLISVLLIYFIFTKIDVQELLKSLQSANLFYLLPAILFFIASKVVSAYRLNLYFHHIGIKLTQQSNLKFYWLGMFYNLFLPGGIGGDAYKGYLLSKNYKVPTKKIVSSLVNDRLSGLLFIYILAALIGLIIDCNFFPSLKFFIAFSIPASALVFYLLCKYLFTSTFGVFWKAFWYAGLVQVFQLAAVAFIMLALNINTNTFEYLLIFLISSIVSVLPLTIGGVGAREVTFFYGAAYFLLEESTSIAVSMLFFIITAVVSLYGIRYHVKSPRLETTD